MKKLLLTLISVIIGVSAVSARDRISRDVNVLPAAARTVLNTHFKKQAVNHIKIDDKMLGKNEYDVILSNGTEIDFDNDGKVKEVDCGNTAVPSALLPTMLTNYVNKNYKGVKIVGFSVKRNGYEVDLNNGLELMFDRAGNFKSIDD